ncbi:MAG: aminotransferase class I/II-fold pyridoxal phosphate-dependent enzyme, partial [Fibrobacter sp.]|nr:aminotransferase class I/II-fold pyridoxal phosphate-dependent enzyme [Fibrobacter sp.]
MNKRIYLSPPHMCGEEQRLVSDAFTSNWVAPAGPDIEMFEKEFCTYTGASHAVALSSGTAAIHLALQVSGICAGDDVFCQSFTFAGSAFPITYMGANPVFIDSEQDSWNMDPELLKKAIEESFFKHRKPKAVIVVHLYGQTANLSAIKTVCDNYGLILIEDAAESLGALHGDQHTGTVADLGIYSFNGNKIITTSGGGMLVGKNKGQIELARYLSTQAREPLPYYHHVTIGYNYRMSNICAAIGRGQLSVIEARVNKRRAIYEYYVEELKGMPGISLIPRDRFGKANCWLTCILIDKKGGIEPEQVRSGLENENIECRPLWKPMHLQPVFTNHQSYQNG